VISLQLGTFFPYNYLHPIIGAARYNGDSINEDSPDEILENYPKKRQHQKRCIACRKGRPFTVVLGVAGGI
jgi:hypothetical protein